MPNGMRWVGLDVHAHASAVAVLDEVTGEVITRRVTGRPVEVLDVLGGLRRPVRAVYEAGPTGYGLVRRAWAEGIEIVEIVECELSRRRWRRAEMEEELDAIRDRPRDADRRVRARAVHPAKASSRRSRSRSVARHRRAA